MVNDGVSPASTGAKLRGTSGQSQRFLINFELVMGKHWIPCGFLSLEIVWDKVWDKAKFSIDSDCMTVIIQPDISRI